MNVASLRRTMPSSTEAERSVLGCCLSSDRALAQITAYLVAEDFYQPAHRLIYEAITRLYLASRPVDPLTVSEELASRQELERVGSMTEIQRLMDAAPLIANALDYAAIVREKSQLRRLIHAMDDVLAKSYAESDTAAALLDYAAEKIYEIREDRSSAGLESIRDIMGRTINEISALASGKAGTRGVRTGFPSIDQVLGGLIKGTLNIIASRPGMGKSALAFNMALNASMIENITVAIFSLEMSKEEIGARLLSAQAAIDSRLLRRGQLQDQDWDRIYHALPDLYRSRIFIDDSAGTTPIEMLSRCRQLKFEHQLGLVVVDYLQLMSLRTRTENRQQEISEITRSLKLLARELDVPVIACSQLSRAVETRGDKRPLMADLRESGSIEQDADTVSFLYRESYYKKDQPREAQEKAEFIIAKNRAGSTATVELGWLPQFTLFVDLDHSYDDPDYLPPERENQYGDMLPEDSAWGREFQAEDDV
ncbi:MAG: replicative DNA helicase [Bacillota bacterium]|nr:replicative DNA helicase [Bacillota bacterium]